MNCVFCRIPSSSYIAENGSFFAIPDQRPVSKGHVLIISKRHFEDVFSMQREEAPDIQDLLVKVKDWLAERYAPDGYNLGTNCGSHAGQSVFHYHLHVIPRYKSDRLIGMRGLREYISEII
ncbi:MAG: HIT family protein [Candidatus Cloacimonadaceae bacterium]|nr:HIT family protein [Candidatus Cloacimonadaceae bacterium]